MIDLHEPPSQALRSLNCCFKLTNLKFFHKTSCCWLLISIGIGAPHPLPLLAFTKQGVAPFKRKYSTTNHGYGDRFNDNDDVINDIFKNIRGPSSLNLSRYLSDATSKTSADSGFDQYSPPEWNALTAETKVKLAKSLSWEEISKWDFNIVEVADLTTDSLLFVGWALLCAPTAQEAMKNSLGAEADADGDVTGDVGSENTDYYHYHFHERIKVDPRTVCNFLREIERRYKHENPYHNNVHAADVVQTTHCLFQLMGERNLRSIFCPISIYSLILAASFHDVCHPGTSNRFQQNAMTSLAIRYNDRSILENMHSAVGQALLFGRRKRDEWDIFDGWKHEDKILARDIMIKSILATDVAVQASSVLELKSLIGQVRTLAENTDNMEIGENQHRPILSILADVIQKAKRFDIRDSAGTELEGKCSELAGIILRFVLHSADMSNVAKKQDLALYWGNLVCDEFFLQGDQEKEMGLPISPLCNRDTVKRPASQISFIKFVVHPTYDLLGTIIPRVKEEIAPNLAKNKMCWEKLM